MEISYLGHSSFRLKGKTVTLVTDPYSEEIGKFPKEIEAGLVTVSHSHPDHNAIDNIKGNPFVIDGPGEFEIGGVSVIGIPTYHDSEAGAERGSNTLYVIEMEGLRIVHAGDLGHKLSESQLEEIGSVDVALLPVGGTYTIDAKGAAEVMRQLDPWVAIPMHYRQEGTGEKINGQLAGVEDFLKEISKPETPSMAKLNLSADKLPDELQVVVLERK